MPDGAAVRARSARARLLGVGRAAALVVLAAGINGTAAVLAPGYDGTYLSVGTVAVVACLEGTVVGLVAAVAAMLLDRFVSGAPLSVIAAVPFIAALVVAAAGRLLLRHPATRTQPMPEGEAAVLIERLQAELGRVRSEADAHRDAADALRDNAADVESRQQSWREERELIEKSRAEALTAVDQLRTELEKGQHHTERLVAERTSIATDLESERSERAAEAQRASEALEAVSRQLESVGSQLVAHQAELATERNQHAADLADLDRAREQLASRVAEIEQLRAANIAAEKRATALGAQAAARIRELEEQMAQLGPELRTARAATQQALQQSEADAKAARQREERVLAQFEEENATMLRELELTRESLQSMIGERDAALAETASLRKTMVPSAELDRARQDIAALTAERDQVQAEGAATLARLKESADRDIESLRAKAEEHAGEASRHADLRKQAEERLAASQREMRIIQSRLDDLQRRYDDEMRKAAEAAQENDARRDLDTRLAAADELIAALRSQVEEVQSDFNMERIRAVEEKAALDASWGEKLNRIVANLASDHENDLGEAVTARETARAEARQAAAKLQEAQQLLEQAMASRAALSKDVVALRQTLDEERAKSSADREDLEGKLREMVGKLAADHENDVGDILAQREEAKAEVRELRMKANEMQRAFDDATQSLSKMNHELRAARTEIDEEKAKREKLDAEWSDKLQNIVMHLASDHEADIGQATLDKEAARAEARSLNQRISALQQQIENEREVFRTAQQKWTSIRDSLLDKMQKSEERWKKILDQQRREHLTAREAIETELKTLKTSERPLTSEEIAAIRSETFGADEPFGAIEPINPTEPIPALVEPPPPPPPAEPVEDRKPLILIVHHNPALRAMTRDALTGMDYNVLTAADGAEGLKMARNLRPDIVIADASMPKMDGRELCQALKHDEATAATKVVLMSAMYTNEMSIAARESDVPPDDILQKPVKPEALKASVSGLLAVHS